MMMNDGYMMATGVYQHGVYFHLTGVDLMISNVCDTQVTHVFQVLLGQHQGSIIVLGFWWRLPDLMGRQ
jgi:hypothetical protein